VFVVFHVKEPDEADRGFLLLLALPWTILTTRPAGAGLVSLLPEIKR
jgi:hypothetical protein